MEPENHKKIDCSVCNDDGLCKNSPSHKDYEKNNEDVWLGTDIYDCCDYNDKYIEKRPMGTWMVEWMKKIKDNEKNKEPYESDFVKWSKLHSR
tara:strand:- start:149 stop:427 length:279 start_codon:yes stop_codon:yes gene_type:complete